MEKVTIDKKYSICESCQFSVCGYPEEKGIRKRIYIHKGYVQCRGTSEDLQWSVVAIKDILRLNKKIKIHET